MTETTAQQLLEAALHLFSRHGYSATTTRAIAARAGANIGLIAYHFGGKAQLRLACAEAVASRIKAVTAALDRVEPQTPAEAAALLEEIIDSAVWFMVASPASEDVTGFILRETAEDGEVMDLLFQQVFNSRHRALCRIWGLATGQDPEAQSVKLEVFAMIGQVVYFRVGRPMVARRMGWPAMGQTEAGHIAATLKAHLGAHLKRSRTP